MASDKIPFTPVAEITGNASDTIKERLGAPLKFFGLRGFKLTPPIFGDSIIERMRTVEVSIVDKAEEPSRQEAKVVTEVLVKEDMANGGGTVHGGCIGFLIDLCSTMSLCAFQMNTSNTFEYFIPVSQSLNIVYHSPAHMGDTIRIVNTTMTVGARALSVRTEIWNSTHHRLVASGVHVMMKPTRL
ncbi:hypothetical protein BDN72DRAFT_840399 [Pluteus cervinus]|uniref:Uncharacterized protein n=1 Tax=Pluteus cervinus TaxID=181527 RepID=A0ACD3AUL7_9AGAR|nr:hypothetical protein BDN72DRAFT_840399 [Pluteus cervinus]